MNLTQCANGHYYDMDKYSICPFCTGSGTGDRGGNGYDPTVGMPVGVSGDGFGNEDVTVSEVLPGMGNGSMEPTVPEVSPAAHGAFSSGLAQETNDEDGAATVGLINWNAVRENEKMRNEGGIVSRDDERREIANPVVGWLVCISGSNYGQAFTLHSGRNFIGRDAEQNDVGLTGDNSISRVKHAIVIYEPKQRQFYVQSGESSHELVYLNDQGVFANTILKDRDVITLGQTSLVFVPFCDERYGWNVGNGE